MKKVLSLLLVFSLPVVMFLNNNPASAIGVVGSNAVKSMVISAWESAGVKFANKEAKERAFDAWNMKAYEKWQADEAAGKNRDLWDSFEKFTLNPPEIEPIADKPGFGKVLMDLTVYGMAISIGAEIGFAIEDAQIEQRALKYLQSGYDPVPGADYSSVFGFYKKTTAAGGNYKSTMYLYAPNGTAVGSIQSVLENDPALFIGASDFVYTNFGSGIYGYKYKLNYVGRGTSGIATSGSQDKYIYNSQYKLSPTSDVAGGYSYNYFPKAEHVPSITPNENLQSLIVKEPDISTIPDVIPEDVPLIVPTDDPFEDNPYVEPYEPPVNDDEVIKPDNPEIPGNNPDSEVIPDYTPDELPDLETPQYPEDSTGTDATGGLWSTLWDWLKSLLDALYKIVNAILMLPIKMMEYLWDGLIDLVKFLFVPTDGFWDDNINKLKLMFWGEQIDDMVNQFGSIGDANGGSFKSVIVSLMGVDNLKVIDADSINSVLNSVHKWVRGIVFPLLVLFNINMLYKLIRGTGVVDGRTLRGKMGDD